jgi:Rieske Fe-S protein
MGETTRRTVLAGAVGAGTAAMMAGCGGGDESSEYGDKSGKQTPTAAPSESQPSAAPTTGGSGLARTGDIPVGGGKVFEAQRVVVTQPTAGEFKAFSATCTHAGCTVGGVSGGVITCPCHNSRFSIRDGSVQGGPAARALPAKQLTVSGDEITVTG